MKNIICLFIFIINFFILFALYEYFSGSVVSQSIWLVSTIVCISNIVSVIIKIFNRENQ